MRRTLEQARRLWLRRAVSPSFCVEPSRDASAGPVTERGPGYLWILIWVCCLGALPLRAAIELDLPIFVGGYGIGFYEQAARKFESMNPGVRVHVYGDARIADKVRVRALGGDLPDATTAPLYWPNLIRAGKMLDLTLYLKGPNWEGDHPWRESFVPGALDIWRRGEGFYGLPLMNSAWVLYYNKALFRKNGWKAPRTWDELFDLGKSMQERNITPLSLPGVYMMYGDCIFQAGYYSLAGKEGWQAYAAYAPGAHTDPRFIRAAEVARRITAELLIKGWEGMSHMSAQLAFLEGRCAMTFSGTWMVNEMQGKIPDDFELGTVNLPVFPHGLGDPTAILTAGNYFFVFANDDPQRTRLTVDFLRFLTSREMATAVVKAIDSPMAVRDVPLEAFSPRMRDAAQMLTQARQTFAIPEMLAPPGYKQVLIDARQELFIGRITAQQFGERLEVAAAADRARKVNPNQVEVRHPWAASGLLLVVVGLTGWLGWAWWRAPTTREVPVGDGYFGVLRARLAIGFIGPSLILFAALVLLPGLTSFAWAFMHWDGLNTRTWAGLFNFKWLLLESDTFGAALRNNLYLMTVPALVVVPLSLAFAFLISRGVWGAKVFRAVFLFPNLLGGVAATLLWMNVYEPASGLLNASLVALGQQFDVEWLRSFAGYAWLSQDNLYRSLIPIYIWIACGFNLILYLAAMEGIDPQLYEAAEMEGASGWRQFYSITLPMIWEIVVVSVVFLVIDGLNAFELIWLLTTQAPVTNSHTLNTLMVTTMFQDYQVGRATAIAVMTFIFVLLGSAAVMRGLKREVIEV